MIRFDDIRSANYGIQTVDIKGKEYVQVNQRVIAFRKVYPMGFIKTHIEELNDTVCVMTAECGYYQDGQKCVIATGTAREEKGSSFINKGSYVENCETSAVGRALGNAGFGIDVAIASYDEMANAIETQKSEVEIEKEFIKLRGQLSKLGVDVHDDETVVDYIKDKAKVQSLDNGKLSAAEMSRVNEVFESIIKRRKSEVDSSK